MPARPEAVAFDVMGTLFPLEPLRAPLAGLGLPPQALEVWFARNLRDGFALAAAGAYVPFPEVARGTLDGLLAQHGRPPDEAGIAAVFEALSRLPSRPDAGAAMTRLRAAGLRVLALTNGTAKNTRALLGGAGLDELVDEVVSIDDVRAWKPRAAVYHHAARRAGVAPAELALVAAHAWDCHGAARAGLLAGWVSEPERVFAPAFGAPDVRGATLTDVAAALLGLAAS